MVCAHGATSTIGVGVGMAGTTQAANSKPRTISQIVPVKKRGIANPLQCGALKPGITSRW
jgi:hypothetical protein